jgi:hypothetical protein
MNRLLTIFRCPAAYKMDSLKADLLAGLTVALVLIPQSLAYAELAGLPPYYGLYASFLPPLVASLFGSSHQLATGPVAVVSLLTSTTLEPLATAGSQEYIAYAILLALLVGIFQFSLGLLKLGLVVNFISHPVVNGFTNAAALIIASSQLSKIFGVYADKAAHHYETIYRILKAAWHYIHWPTLFVATLAFLIMYGLKRLAPRIPNVIVAVVITTVLSWAFGFEHTSITDISALNSTEVNPAISRFNRTVNSIALLSQKRSGLIRDLSNSGQTADALQVLETKYALERVNVQIEQFKDQAATYREELRSFLFESVRQNGGSLRFYPAGAIPEKIEGDGRIWRIEVGNSPLSPHRLKITGGGEVVGKIPRGLPALSMPEIDLDIIMPQPGTRRPGAGQYLRRCRQKLPDFRIFLPIGCKPAVRSNFQPVQRIHQYDSGGRSFVFYAVFVPSAAIGAGGNHHDGRRWFGQRQGVYTRMAGAVV